MAWTTPRTWVVNEFVTASLLNTHVRDNENALRDYLLGAQDLLSNWKIGSGRSLLFQDSDVAHGMTTVQATDVYGALAAASGTAGGIQLTGLSDVDAIALSLAGYIGTATPGGTNPVILLSGAKKNGTGAQALAAQDFNIGISNGGGYVDKFYGDGGLNIVGGGLSVGYSGVPTAGALSIGDANYKGYLNGAAPTIQFDANDDVSYDRSNNRWSFLIGGTPVFQIGAGFAGTTGGAGITAGVDGSGGPNDGCVIIADERTTGPTAPSLGGCKLYLIDNGAGKTKLMAQFSAGVAQQVAIQP